MSVRSAQAVRLYILACCLGTPGAAASACSVPVFRYALERWPADDYDLVVFHRGTLVPQDQAALDWLERFESQSRHLCYANYTVHTVNLGATLDESVRALWEAQSDAVLPWMVVRCPNSFPEAGIVWSGRLDAAAAKRVVDSPLRQQTAERILKGQAAVWILLESGNKAQDDKAANKLQSELGKITRLLNPASLVRDSARETWGDEGAGSNQPIAFSMVRLSRSDPAERMLVNTLLASEADLRSYAQPIAFPVFGRGRVLYALVGKGINEQNIGEACAFLVTGCSCAVKAENPGTDLLMLADWQAAMEGQWDESAQFPVPAGLPRSSAPSAPEADRSTILADTMNGRPSSALLRNSLIGVALGLVVVALGALILTRRDRSSPSQQRD